uniref:Uncharacterized protein n=1 Tax=Rhizophora mucronata TaxID=61149 RepID=A0A2P2PK10_RHIMU
MYKHDFWRNKIWPSPTNPKAWASEPSNEDNHNSLMTASVVTSKRLSFLRTNTATTIIECDFTGTAATAQHCSPSVTSIACIDALR